MKKARKLLVTLLVLTFVMSMFNVGFAAEEEKLPTEVVRAQALGILKGDDQGNLNLDQPITRAEALALIVRISGLEKSAELMAGQTQFADVNAAPNLQWATGYINLGVGQGIVNGYPDGTFKGTNQVTYAEMAKMLLYAMNYGVTVEGGVWPAAVMGKADDLGIFDKVNALPNVPALRGDVVKMIDNSLTVNHLKQTGFGDLTQYLEDVGVNFLSKMDVEELEDVRVTDIARVNNKLDDDEIELTEYDKNGRVADSNIYTLIADVNAEEIFGLEVDAWVNDDDEVFFVKVKTAEKDILNDTVAKNTASKIELLVADDEYKVSSEAEIFVNFNLEQMVIEVDEGEDEVLDLQNAYGKIVLDRGEIIFANFFMFEDNGVVTEVDDETIKYFKDSDSIKRINLDDYDAYYIYDKNFKEAALEDISEDSAIFWFENDDDEIFIVVVNEKVEGELTKAKDSEITVDGKKIKTSKVSNATISSNDNDDVVKFVATAGATEDLLGEDVIVILDVNGRVRHIVGDAETVSGTNYGIVTDAYRSGKYYYANIFTKDGEEVEYKFEKNADGQAVEE
ncbi:MAG: S-layer homology domain-containing protein [Tepidanaerobacteraceae bacterium]